MRKKLGWFLMLVIVLVSLTINNVLADARSIAIVNNPNPADRLHLREAPDRSSKSLGKYYNGTEVQIIDELDNNWVKVSIGGETGTAIEGYMMKEYLEFDNQVSVANAMPRYMSGSSAWEVYAEPDQTSAYRNCGYGHLIYLMGFTDDWWHVKVIGEDGTELMTGFASPASGFEELMTVTIESSVQDVSVKMYDNPDEASTIICELQDSTQATLLGYASYPYWAWVEIDETGLIGYIQASDISIN